MSTPQDSLPEPRPEEPMGSTRSVSRSADSESFTVTPPPEAMGQEPLDQQKTVISRRPGSTPVPALTPITSGRLLEGEQLEHFHLEELVGGGGMGAVYRAKDTLLGRQVAVKVIAGDQQDEETLKRFQNEAQNAARLDHPNIARVHHVGSDKGWHYIVFEFIRGVNIRELVEHKGPLPFDEAFSYTLQVAEALDHAFRRGVIHRDIKPSNIIVMPDGSAKLVDMGLARFSDMESSSNDLTASGVTLGTFDYISPEQARDPRDADVRSDIYSLGCTFFYMLTAQPPFPNGTVLQKLFSHSSDPPPDIREFRDDADADLAALIDKTLSKKPADRQQEPSELSGELLMLAKRWELPIVGLKDQLTIRHREQGVRWWEAHLYWLVPVLLLIAGVFTVKQTTQAELKFPERELPELKTTSLSPEPTAVDAGASSDSNKSPENAAELGTKDGEETLSNPIPSDNAATPTGTEPEESPVKTGVLTTGQESDSTPNPGPAPESTRDSATAPAVSLPYLPDDGTPRVVVGNAIDLAGSTVQVADTFEEAMQIATDHPEINEVMLAFDGPRAFDLLELRPERADGRELRVVAAPYCRPVFHFDLNAEELKSQIKVKHPAMIGIVGGEIVWQGVDFSMHLPESPFEARDSWSLIRVDHVSRVAFDDCTATVRNADDEGTMIHMSTAIIDFAGTDTSQFMPDQEDRPLPANRIELSNCVARGEASLLRCREAVPFAFDWTNGFLATTEHLFVKAKGSGAMSTNTQEEIVIQLNRVTAVTDDTLCEVDWKSSAKPIKLVLELQDSIVRSQSSDHVLIKTAGIESFAEAPELVEFKATRSYVPYSEVCWRIVTDESEPPLDHSFSDSLTAAQSWFTQFEPVLDVTWTERGDNLPLSKHTWTPALFRLSDSSAKKPGFLMEDLPKPQSFELPGASVATPALDD